MKTINIIKSATIDDRPESLELIQRVVEHAQLSGTLRQQVNPFTDQPLLVSLLTRSHAAFVATAHTYLEAKSQLEKSGMSQGV